MSLKNLNYSHKNNRFNKIKQIYKSKNNINFPNGL